MSNHEYITAQRMPLHEILKNPTNRKLARRYARTCCKGTVKAQLLRLTA